MSRTKSTAGTGSAASMTVDTGASTQRKRERALMSRNLLGVNSSGPLTRGRQATSWLLIGCYSFVAVVHISAGKAVDDPVRLPLKVMLEDGHRPSRVASPDGLEQFLVALDRPP